MVENFVTQWTAVHFCRCRVIDDVAVTEEQERSYNLVLIGSERSNAVWQRYAPQLGLRAKPTGVSYYNHEFYAPTGYVFNAVDHNPRFRERSLLLIGSLELKKARLGRIDLTVHGWFDIAVWDGSGDSKAKNLLVAGWPGNFGNRANLSR